MSWTAGFAITSARDVAKFYWDLLGPERYLLSEESLKKQTSFELLDSGYNAGLLPYGGGLMLRNINLTKSE